MKTKLFLFILMLIGFNACKSTQPRSAVTHIIPQPLTISESSGFSDITRLKFSEDEKDLKQFESWLLDNNLISDQKETEVNVNLLRETTFLEGAYHIEINKDKVLIKYNSRVGLRNAFSTLLQIFVLNQERFPIIKIQDQPRFSYRGMHLDVARHMYSLDEIKQYLDYLAFYKFNYFHWHLTEDQGWRIEIKQYPRIQEIATKRKETLIGHYNDNPQKFDGRPYGGYYTQAQIKEIVKYAYERGIEVIPEIDIPGHSTALIAAYPELSCHGNPVEVATKWGVFFDILCPTESTFEFLENLFDEIIPLFPSSYIHIGGDECPKDQWRESAFCQALMQEENLKDEAALQSYFIKRIEKYLNSKGKKIIGWDEILEGGLAPNATVMSWRGEQGGIAAAQQGHSVIMTPTSHCYFDYYQSESESEPLAIGGYIPFEKVYNWNLVPSVLTKEEKKHIIGAQGNVWSEYLPLFKDVEYAALARMITLSEVLWGRYSSSLEHFSNLLYVHTNYWKSKAVNIADHLLDLNAVISQGDNHETTISFQSKIATDHIYASLNNSEPTKVVGEHMQLQDSGTYSFYATKDGTRGNPVKINYIKHKGTAAKILMKSLPSEKYFGKGPYSIINGVEGPDNRYGGSEWLGFRGKDLVADIIFPNLVSISSVSFKFFNGPGQWIYLPKDIELDFFDEAENSIEQVKIEVKGTTDKICKLEEQLDIETVKKVSMRIRHYGMIPEGAQGGGHPAWLFVDEVVFN